LSDHRALRGTVTAAIWLESCIASTSPRPVVRLFVAALGNDTVEALDAARNTHLTSFGATAGGEQRNAEAEFRTPGCYGDGDEGGICS
jgi:hypothetical protein